MTMLNNRDHDDRPWGSFDRFTHNELSTVKILHLKPGKRVSLQKHTKRNEWWKILKGSGTVDINGIERTVIEGDEAEVPLNTLHRITGGPEGITWLEIALGEFDEDDIERVEDDYGRGSPD